MSDRLLIALIGVMVIVLVTGKLMRWVLPARQVARKEVAPRGCGGFGLVLLMLLALWVLLDNLVSDPVTKAQHAISTGGEPLNQMIAGIVCGVLFGSWLMFGVLKIQDWE